MMMKPVAVITGASGGIGIHLVKYFVEIGYTVVAIDQNKSERLPQEVVYIECDLSEKAAAQKILSEVKATTGYADLLINNAAIAHFSKPLLDVSDEEVERLLQVNLAAVIELSRAFISLNEGRPYGRIINIASTRFGQNEAHWDLYGASKGGIVSLTNSLAISLSDKPITVNAISPGWIHCDEASQLKIEDHSQHPSGRVGKPADIVKACAYLADPENDFVNGANLIIDGGMSKKMIYLE